MTLDVNAIGRAGEHYVCADLCRRGLEPLWTSGACRYDLAVPLVDRLLQIQVKAVVGPRQVSDRRKEKHYIWSLRCGGDRGYRDGELDAFALVALDRPGQVVYQSASAAPTRAFSIAAVPRLGKGWGVARHARRFVDYSFESLLVPWAYLRSNTLTRPQLLAGCQRNFSSTRCS